MEVFGILGYLFSIKTLDEVRRINETEDIKMRWRIEQCSNGIHFNYLGRCSACNKLLTQDKEK